MKQDIKIQDSKFNIPSYVTHVTEILENAGFEAFIVGGSVRDLILGREPKDWDVTTNAKPEEVQSLFEKTVYENRFGTVAVVVSPETTTDSRLEIKDHSKAKNSSISHETPENITQISNLKSDNYIVEVTTYRNEAGYSDARHPDTVEFAKTVEEDLERRDFTINAMAYDSKGHLKDIYDGLKDIKDKVVRTVGNPDERFSEDALRMLRAVRFSAQLGFAVSYETLESISKNAHLLKEISAERIRDEFEKIIMSADPMAGVGLLVRLGLNKYIVPELEEGVGNLQGGEHIYDVFEHILHALGHAAEKNWPLDIRLAALFHDIGKPRSRRLAPSLLGNAPKKQYTFYGHEVIGARMVSKIMERLKFPNDISKKVTNLVRYHMFFSDTEAITLSAVRRTIVNVSRENIWDLMEVRECDRVGMKKKEAPYRLRKYHAMIEEALRAPTSVGMLKINGEVLIKDLGIKAGPRMGWMLHALLEECLEDDKKNEIEYLKNRALELAKLSDKELKSLGEAGKQAKDEKEGEELGEIRKKHGVK